MSNSDEQDLTSRAMKSIESLCRIDSRTITSPDGATEVSAVLGRELAAMGFECRQVPCETTQERRGMHLVATRNPGAGGKIVLLGHADTVLGPSEVPFRCDASEGRVFGSGVCDMKGGLVLMVEAIRLVLADEEIASRAELAVVVNASEEAQTEHFGDLLRDTCRGARACLCFEGAYAAADSAHILPNARKGIFRARLSCTGVSGHAGNNHPQGANAIREIARKVEIIESLTDYDRNLTANVGHISGGRCFNQIPDEASADFEIRSFDPELLQATKEELSDALTRTTVRSADDSAECNLSVTWSSGFRPFPRNEGTDDLLERYTRIAEKEGFRVTAAPRGGASDANFICNLVPALDGLGPVGGGMHSPAEWADVRSFAARSKAAAGLIRELAKGD